MGHMCITMGTAEAIAIRMIVTANIFAISPRLWPALVRPFFSDPTVCAAARAQSFPSSLFRLKGEIGSSRLAGGNRHFLRLRAVGLLPRSHGVVSGRHVVDGVGAVTIGGRVRPFYHRMPAMHPGMDVALYFDKLHSFPALLDWRRPRRLRLIPRDIAGHRVWVRVNVVGRLIAGSHLELLVDVQRQHVWRVHTVLLIE